MSPGPPAHGGNISVTREQLLSWNPDIIIAERGSAYQALLHSPGWRQLPAVRARKVYLRADATRLAGSTIPPGSTG